LGGENQPYASTWWANVLYNDPYPAQPDERKKWVEYSRTILRRAPLRIPQHMIVAISIPMKMYLSWRRRKRPLGVSGVLGEYESSSRNA
jgi:hypothetical protein